MYALVEWTDEQKYTVIALSRVKEPRKDFQDYKEGDLVKASCPGFPGIHPAKLIAIRGNATEDKKELERMAIEIISQLVEKENAEHDTGKQDKRKKKSNDDRPQKKSKKTPEKDSREQIKDQKQKKREDQLKNREIQLNKNRAFLESLNSFKETVASALPERPSSPRSPTPPPYIILDLDTQENVTPHAPRAPQQEPVPFPPPQKPSQQEPWQNHQYTNGPWNHHAWNYIHPQPGQQNHQIQPQISSLTAPVPWYPHTPTRNNYMMAQNIFSSSPDTPCTGTTVQHAPMPNASTPVIAQTPFKEQTSPSLEERPIQSNQDDKESCQGCNTLRTELDKAKSKINRLEEQLKAYKGETSTSYLCQSDGRPRAGVVPSDIADANHMIELLPGSGVYLYPNDLRVVMKKDGGCRKARFLLSVFYTNEELVEAGNLTGVNGKKGLCQRIVKTIADYSVMKTGQKIAEINLAMRSKVSALVCTKQKTVLKL